MTKGAELDQQIYKRGTPTNGCEESWLDVKDVKECFRDIELRMLKRFGKTAAMILNTIILDEAGRKFR